MAHRLEKIPRALSFPVIRRFENDRPDRESRKGHDACHLAHGQRARSQVRSLLAAIPDLTLVPLREADFCCGSAGIYNLLHPELSREFLNRKLDRLAETQADLVVAGNPGCLIQIVAGLRVPMRAAHTIELLDWSYRGVTPQTIIA